MTTRKILFCRLLVMAGFTFMIVLLLYCHTQAAPYQPCNIPPIVGAASRPNLLIVQDYSGSMQFPTFYDGEGPFTGYYSNGIAACYSDTLYKAYDQTYSYFGTFESDSYYIYVPTTGSTTKDYFALASPQPVIPYSITSSADGGGRTSIAFTAAGHTFQVGDLVAFNGLSSHLGMNGNAYTVTAVSGSTFTVTGTANNTVKWNGTADTAGTAVKRIYGSLAPDSNGNVMGISGNVLNFAITTRIDAALKALIGGRSISPSGDNYMYIRPQGSRRRVQDNTSLNADFYIRPATLESSATFPDDYSSSGGYYKDSNGHDRDIFVTIKGSYSGALASNSPQMNPGSGKYRYFESWQFTISQATRVQLSLTGQWPNNSYLAVYTTPPSNNFTGASPYASNQGNPAAINQDFPAGTYYVVATYADTSTTSSYQKPYMLTSSVNIKPYVVSGYANNGTILTKIGALPMGRARLQLQPTATGNKDSRQGVVQTSFPYVRFGLMYFKSDSNANIGKIAVGCDNTDMSLLINAFEGVSRTNSANVDFTQIYPYYGTTTGEALQAAQDYFAQTNTAGYADNSYFIQKGTLIDPYYSQNAAGQPMAVPCRSSHLLLISDGQWNGSIDPVGPAQQIHTTDLRPDIGKTQAVDMYTVYIFDQTAGGSNSMAAIAMYGGFKHISGCGASASYPWPETGLPSSSLTFAWPVTQCNPANADCTSTCSNSCYCDSCCKEWNAVWDRNNDGTNENKGWPDNYFKADSGQALTTALNNIMQAVTSGNAAASAVATVSQETQSEDIIVRGVFQAGNPDNPDNFLWYGHLEAYLPFTNAQGTVQYDFELPSFLKPSNPDLSGLCIGQPSSSRHCWDAGSILSAQAPVAPNNRNVYTWLFDSFQNKYVQKNFTSANLQPSDLGVTTTTDRDNIISWARGNSVSSYRNRNGWILGDIIYSTPVLIGPPRLGAVSTRDPNIQSFYTHMSNESMRSKVIYVGANDGMLHAFLMGTTTDGQTWAEDPSGDPNIGEELWAYVPSNLLTELKALTSTSYGASTGPSPCTHRTMVDLAARYWEVYIKSDYCGSRADAQGRCWRTVIIGGERGGGDVYFAIDVTDPVPDTADPTKGPHVLWEYSVLKNRVVVEQDVTTDATCLQACRNTCIASGTTIYNNCMSTCKPKNSNSCKTSCTTQQNNYTIPCENNCTKSCTSVAYHAYVPFSSAYQSIKTLPMSWSQPFLGRIHIPTSVKFYYGAPDPNTMFPVNLIQFDSNNNNREVVFMSSGIHIYDKSFDTTPTVDDRFKLALFWPDLLMLDIETGYNLFEYVWPDVLNYNATSFPNQQIGNNTIPYAMSDVLAVDVYDQMNNVIGDDGFIDHVYVGDMNGYFYGIKFNLAENFPNNNTTNSNFGIEVNIWPTKTISVADQPTDDYRSYAQPITVGPVASFEALAANAPSTAIPALRLIFGTGKYDDVIYGTDDKTDTAKMSLYNLRDSAMLPAIDPTKATQVFDSAHKTNFMVQFAPHCGVPGSVSNFSTNCNWQSSQKVTDPTDSLFGLFSGDCCESSNAACANPCYSCIYDFRSPCDTAGVNGCLTPIDSMDAPAAGKPGERVIGKPLLTGGNVFVTTYVPPYDPCGYTGQAYLYVFNYMCQPFPADYNPFPDDTTVIIPSPSGGSTGPAGFQVSLGSGVPSRPVIDSKGQNIIIQMSDGTLKRMPVNLAQNKPVQFKGWRER